MSEPTDIPIIQGLAKPPARRGRPAPGVPVIRGPHIHAQDGDPMSTPINPDESRNWALTIPEPIPPGLYDASVAGIELRIAEADGREWLAWNFTLDDGREVGGGSSYSISPRSKSYAWISAILGRALMGGGSTITATDLVGMPCTVNVGEDAEGFAKVEAVMPPRAAKP